jgi:DNA-binding NtrC family response regulator
LTGAAGAGTIRRMPGSRASDPTRRHAGSVLVVDDDEDVLLVCARALRDEGFEARSFNSATPVLEALEVAAGRVDVVLSDIHMPDLSGLELLAAVHERWPTVVVILMTGQADLESAVQALRLGAYDYLVKPVEPFETLVPAARRAVEYRRLIERNRFLQRRLDASERFGEMVGSSSTMQRVHELIASVAPTEATVLILGASGTGKELVARAIHAQSGRSAKAFVDINCAALAESVLDSELFGHVRGAFTGAVTGRRGLFEEASGGTLFLDEIGEFSASTQARLLRVLQEGEVRPVGSNESRSVDVRVVAATNRDLAAAVKERKFREDLYYRLNVMTIELPPLRERSEDIAPLAHHFLKKRGERIGKQVAGIDPEALELLTSYPWPGNVRELENTIERAIILARTDQITVDLLPASVRQNRGLPPTAALLDAGRLPPLAEARVAFERSYLQRALELAQGNITEAAELAQVDRSNFRRLMRRLGLERDPDAGA